MTEYLLVGVIIMLISLYKDPMSQNTIVTIGRLLITIVFWPIVILGLKLHSK